MSGISRPALSGQVDASANIVPCEEALDAFACAVAEMGFRYGVLVADPLKIRR